MNDDKIKKTSDPSENKADSSADSRFDVLDNLDFDDVGSNDYSVNVAEESSGDKVESTLDDLLLELDEMERRTEKWQNSTDVPYFKPSKSFTPKDDEPEAPTAPASEPETDPEPVSEAAAKENTPHYDDDAGIIDLTHPATERSDNAPRAGAHRGAPVPGAKKPGAAKNNFVASDVDRAAQSITTLVETGKLSSALDLVLSLRGQFRLDVKEKASITIPLGSRDSDLRRIAAGALMQSYLDQGKIVRRDLENKLYAIIESSEPDYDENNEVIEQSEDDLLYKVTACMVFAAELTERSGNHPNEKSAMYAAGDSVLDSFLADNMNEVQRSNRKRLAMLASAINASGGEVAAKFNEYYEETKKSSGSALARFLGKETSFWIATAVVALTCLITVILYIALFPGSGANAFIGFAAKDNSPLMLFAIFMELFFIIGLGALCVILTTGSRGRKGGR